MSDEEDWSPPSEAELKVIQARRERSDKISKLMGDYLLKGYRMLATCCPQCSNIELQDRSGNKYCVACQEVDCHETSKDNPAISQRAADRGIAEEAFAKQRSPSIQAEDYISTELLSSSITATTSPTVGAASVTNSTSSATLNTNPDLIPRGQVESLGARSRVPVYNTPPISSSSFVHLNNNPIISGAQGQSDDNSTQLQSLLTTSLNQVMRKLDWANSELSSSQTPARTTELVILVRECAETAHALQLILSKP